jgi:hypothetical protein
MSVAEDAREGATPSALTALGRGVHAASTDAHPPSLLDRGSAVVSTLKRPEVRAPKEGPSPAPAPATRHDRLVERLRLYRKPRAGVASELTRFKLLWDESLSEEEKDFWRETFVSSLSVKKIRDLLRDKLKIKLQYRGQLNRMREHVQDRDARAEEQRQMKEDEAALRTAHPDWTLDQVRDDVIKRAYYRTLARGDFILGLRVIQTHLAVKKSLLDLEKFKFDAITVCRQLLPQLKAIETTSTMTEAEKTAAFMERIFGPAPAKQIEA